MQEPEFEKKVRVKMNELKFSPSDSVWANVELQIKKDTKTRRPLIWFFITGAFLLLGLVVFQMIRVGPAREVKSSTQKTIAASNKETRDKRSGNNEIIDNKAKTRDSRDKEIRIRQALSQQENRGERIVVVGKSETGGLAQPNELMDEIVRNDDKKDPPGNSKNKIQDTKLESKFDAIAEEQLSTNASKEPNPVSVENDKNAPDTKPAPPAISAVIEQNKPGSKAGVAAVEGSGDKSIQTQQPGKKHPWKFSFVIAPGISNVQAGQLFHQTTNSLTYAAAFSPGANPTVMTNSTYYEVTSNTKSSLSFLVGGAAQKYLSRYIYFTAGLNYHYYSNVANFNFTSSNASVNSSSQFSNTNVYHFIELPAGLGFHLTRQKKSPLIAELGFTLSQLIQANAYQVDGNGGVYHASGSAFNHTQAYANLALLLNLTSKKNDFTLGPVFQYGLTNLVSSGTLRAEHLFFAGFRFGISLKK